LGLPNGLWLQASQSLGSTPTVLAALQLLRQGSGSQQQQGACGQDVSPGAVLVRQCSSRSSSAASTPTGPLSPRSDAADSQQQLLLQAADERTLSAAAGGAAGGGSAPAQAVSADEGGAQEGTGCQAGSSPDSSVHCRGISMISWLDASGALAALTPPGADGPPGGQGHLRQQAAAGRHARAAPAASRAVGVPSARAQAHRHHRHHHVRIRGLARAGSGAAAAAAARAARAEQHPAGLAGSPAGLEPTTPAAGAGGGAEFAAPQQPVVGADSASAADLEFVVGSFWARDGLAAAARQHGLSGAGPSGDYEDAVDGDERDSDAGAQDGEQGDGEGGSGSSGAEDERGVQLAADATVHAARGHGVAEAASAAHGGSDASKHGGGSYGWIARTVAANRSPSPPPRPPRIFDSLDDEPDGAAWFA
jgi:hypothetical protein